VKNRVGVEKETKAVILANFCIFVEREFNNLQTAFCGRNTIEGVFQQPLALTLITLYPNLAPPALDPAHNMSFWG